MVTNSTNTCPYATMCGWCSKWDKKCDRKIGTATQIDPKYLSVTDISELDTANSISSKPKRCGSCDKTDGMCYTSNPPQVKCTITGRFHFYDDICDCNTLTAMG